jgi:ferric enterobactin receptor
MKKYLLIIVIAGVSTGVFAQQTQKILKKSILTNRLFTCALDEMLDTISMTYHLKIVFDRDEIHKYDVVDHFFNESLKDVLDRVLKRNDLHYWIESDGTMYILQSTDDLDRLKRLNQLKASAEGAIIAERLAVPVAPPKNLHFSITGKVIDQNTGESVPYATVTIRNTDLSANTNNEGSFTIFNVPADTCVLITSYSGYQTDRLRLDAKMIKDPLMIYMFPALNTLNEVTVAGKKSGVMNTDTKKVGVLQLTPAALDKLPNMGEKDILRAFQLMPGVSGTNESSSGAYVRGGTPDQNLVIFDGFTVYQVDHLYGFFSAFNSNAVKDVQLYKGGFSSQYGGRLSSVTEINGKDGDSKEPVFGVDLSLLSINLIAETPVTANSSLLLAFRRSYQGPLYDKIFGQFNASTAVPQRVGGGGFGGGGGGGFGHTQTTPASHFYDADMRYTYHINTNNTLALSMYSGTDKTDNSRDMSLASDYSATPDAIKINDYTKYGNLSGSLKWYSQWNKNLHSNTYITYSSYFNDRNRGTTGTITQSDLTVSSIDNGTVENNNLKDIGVKSEWELQLNNKVKVLFGGFGTHEEVNYDYIQNDTTHLISQHNKTFLGGGYAELEIDPNSKLHIQPGIRSTWFQATGKVYYEPRFSASYVLSDRFTLKAATGQFYQFMNQVTREDVLEGNRNFWVVSNGDNIPVGMARHYMGGVSYETDKFLIDVEGYYKTLDGLTQYTITQQNVGPGSSSSAATVDQNFYTGTGRDKGIEVLLQKKLGFYTGWISYTLASAENKFAVYGNSYYPADQDITHEFKSINMYHYDRWNFSAVFIFSTGHPYTVPLSSYTVTAPDGNTTTAFNVGAKNAERLPDYHRLDMSATYDLLKISGNKVGSIGLSLFNVYNHKNIWYREYQVQNNQIITTDVTYLGFTPNITLSLRWK